MSNLALYLLICFATATVTFLATPLAISYARSKRVLDSPYGHKTHSQSVPYLGGLAMVSGLLIGTFLTGFAPSASVVFQDALILMTITIGFAILGLYDDLRNLSPTFRLLFEIVLSLIAVLSIQSIDTVFPFWLDSIITTFWFVAMVNAFNMIDNQDGLAAGQSAICAIMFFVVAHHNGQILVPILCSMLIGSTVSFLRYNFHPAKIYMGDSGAYALGFVIAFLGVQTDSELVGAKSLLMAPIILAVPVLDLLLVTTTRIFHRRHPFIGGQDHFTHRLMRKGLSKVQAVSFSYLTSFYFGMLAILGTSFPGQSLYFFGFALISMAIVFHQVWRISPGY